MSLSDGGTQVHRGSVGWSQEAHIPGVVWGRSGRDGSLTRALEVPLILAENAKKARPRPLLTQAALFLELFAMGCLKG